MPDPADTPLTRAIQAGAEALPSTWDAPRLAETVLRAALPVLAYAAREQARQIDPGDYREADALRTAAFYLDAWASEGDQQ